MRASGTSTITVVTAAAVGAVIALTVTLQCVGHDFEQGGHAGSLVGIGQVTQGNDRQRRGAANAEK